jgi:hypothetical protein
MTSASSIMLSSPLPASACALFIKAAALRPDMIFSIAIGETRRKR